MAQTCAAADASPRPDLMGLGFSDPAIYSDHLLRLTSYVNTWFHEDGSNDLTSFSTFDGQTYDYVICSEVLEHIDRPIERAFETLYQLLNPDGMLVISVPLQDGKTREHFAEWVSSRLQETPHGWELEFETQSGIQERRSDLVFHGGPGSTLEMRLFGRDDFREHLARVGFVEIHEHREQHPEWGIVTTGTPPSMQTPGGRVHGMHAGVWTARKPNFRG